VSKKAPKPLPETPKRRERYLAVRDALLKVKEPDLKRISGIARCSVNAVKRILDHGYGPWAPPLLAAMDIEMKAIRMTRRLYIDTLRNIDELSARDASLTTTEEAVMVALMRRSSVHILHNLQTLAEAIGSLSERAAVELRMDIDTSPKDVIKLFGALMKPIKLAADLADTTMQLERRLSGEPEVHMAISLAEKLESATDEELEAHLRNVVERGGETLRLIRGGGGET